MLEWLACVGTWQWWGIIGAATGIVGAATGVTSLILMLIFWWLDRKRRKREDRVLGQLDVEQAGYSVERLQEGGRLIMGTHIDGLGLDDRLVDVRINAGSSLPLHDEHDVAFNPPEKPDENA